MTMLAPFANGVSLYPIKFKAKYAFQDLGKKEYTARC